MQALAIIFCILLGISLAIGITALVLATLVETTHEIIDAKLAGFVSGPGVVNSSDSIIGAIQKVDGNVGDITAITEQLQGSINRINTFLFSKYTSTSNETDVLSEFLLDVIPSGPVIPAGTFKVGTIVQCDIAGNCSSGGPSEIIEFGLYFSEIFVTSKTLTISGGIAGLQLQFVITATSATTFSVCSTFSAINPSLSPNVKATSSYSVVTVLDTSEAVTLSLLGRWQTAGHPLQIFSARANVVFNY